MYILFLCSLKSKNIKFIIANFIFMLHCKAPVIVETRCYRNNFIDTHISMCVLCVCVCLQRTSIKLPLLYHAVKSLLR